MRIHVLGTLGLFLFSSCGSEPVLEVEEPRNLLLVTIDTLRADRLGCYGYSGAETPRIDALASRGVRFENAQSVAPITMVAHTSLMTGTIPPHHGVRDNGSHRALPELTTLAEVLSAAKFRTAGFTAAFVLDSIYGLDQGFETYGDVPQRQATPTSEFEERPGHEVNLEAMTWLDRLNKDERFFLWVHYFEPHLPYPPIEDLPAKFRARPYDAEIAMADRILGQLLDRLKELGHMNDTLIVVTSDHGESLGEHGEETHSFFVYQGVLHIPLIMAHPSLPQGKLVADRVSLVDVMPTILELLDVAPPATPPPGNSLLPLMQGSQAEPRPVYFESWVSLLSYGWAPLQGVAVEDQKFIQVPRPELYQLDRDPTESHNLYAEDPASAKILSDTLERLLEQNEDLARIARARREMSAEERGKLASLGYTGSAAGSEPEITLRDPKDGIDRIQKEQSIRKLIDSNQTDLAIKALFELLGEDPRNPVFNAHLGLLYMAQNRHGEAIPPLLLAIDNGLDNATTRSNLGTCYMKVARYQAAKTELYEALQQNPKHLISLFWLARTHAALDEKQEARQRFEEILELWDGGEGPLTQQVRQFIAELDS